MLTAQDPLDTATELEQPLWRIARHTAIYPKEKRIAAEIPLARQDFMDMAAVMEKHMERREYLVGGAVTVADLVAAYTLDMATVGWASEARLLSCALPSLERKALIDLRMVRRA